ncbi:hypothetical protein EAG_00991 [Camponotus floridanus]|uniref:Uncharacterized protein n=1 Tax=Camponotus floridanus TaxID=104421 RepID=E2ALX4_CAMFO|nr:hypothetical protein EAG_00991 [Camponotus floridanus]
MSVRQHSARLTGRRSLSRGARERGGDGRLRRQSETVRERERNRLNHSSGLKNAGYIRTDFLTFLSPVKIENCSEALDASHDNPPLPNRHSEQERQGKEREGQIYREIRGGGCIRGGPVSLATS